MESYVLDILKKCGILVSNNKIVVPQEVNRELFLSDKRYTDIQENIPLLKLKLSSSSLTSLQSPAGVKQKWPLLNLVRQLLKLHNYKMEPKRRCIGKDINGCKKYVRSFMITQQCLEG